MNDQFSIEIATEDLFQQRATSQQIQVFKKVLANDTDFALSAHSARFVYDKDGQMKYMQLISRRSANAD